MTDHDRTQSIGASDAAAAIGASPWKSQFQLWSEKTGLAQPPNLDEKEAVYWGKALEASIINAFANRTGRHTFALSPSEPTRHPDNLFMTATPDAIQEAEGRGGDGVLEVKNAGHWAGKPWEDGEPPLHYQVQVQHQLACTGLTWGTLCALVGGQKLIWFDVERNQRFIDSMIAKEAFFWTQVIDRVPPEPDGSIATTDVLKLLYPKDDGQIISLPEDAAKWDDLLQRTKASIKTAEQTKCECENWIKAAIGNATTGVLPDGSMYTFKQQIVNHKAKEAWRNEFRVLRRKAVK